MARIARAALTLVDQVAALKPRANWETAGEPDGIGVHRSIRFSRAAGGWLKVLLEQIDDPRIESLEEVSDGLVVTFVSGPRADFRDPFPLADAQTVLEGSSTSGD